MVREMIFFAAAGGFEYSLQAVAGTNINVRFFSEYAYDNRGNDATMPYQNDFMAGIRLEPNVCRILSFSQD